MPAPAANKGAATRLPLRARVDGLEPRIRRHLPPRGWMAGHLSGSRPSHALPDRKETSRKVTPVSQADLTVSITTRSGTMPIRELLKAESAVFGPDELRDIAAAFEVIRERLGLTNREDPATLMLAKLRPKGSLN